MRRMLPGAGRRPALPDRDGDSRGPTLHALARELAARGCEQAQNLDGGPSTGAAWREGDAVRLVPRRGMTRHAVVFTPIP